MATSLLLLVKLSLIKLNQCSKCSSSLLQKVSNEIFIFAVQAKLRCLHDFHLRLLHNTVPLPSGVDIANTIKYFSQTLLSEY